MVGPVKTTNLSYWNAFGWSLRLGLLASVRTNRDQTKIIIRNFVTETHNSFQMACNSFS